MKRDEHSDGGQSGEGEAAATGMTSQTMQDRAMQGRAMQDRAMQDQTDEAVSTEEAQTPAEDRQTGGQHMSQRVEAVLNASGLRGPALASLEGGSGLFALTEEHLIFHDTHGTRRVTLRDLARIHSDAEGTLRVETPAGVAMSASLIGFDGDAVQQFFGQVRDVTARIKSLTPPPLTPAPSAPSRPAPRPAPAQAAAAHTTSAPARPEPSRSAAPAHSVGPVSSVGPVPSVGFPSADPTSGADRGMSVTPARRPDAETQRFSGPAPRITVNRGGQREQLADGVRGPRENGLGLSGTVGSALGRNLPPPGSVEIRAVRHTAPGTPAAPVAHGTGPHVTAPPLPLPPEQDETAEREAAEQAHLAFAGPQTHAQPQMQPPQMQQPQPQPHPAAPEPLHYTPQDLGTQAGRVRGVPGRLRLLAAVLIVGAVITALLMFLNAQRLFALWVLIAGVVGAVALLSLAELTQLQTIQAAVLAGPDAPEEDTEADTEAEADPSEPESAEQPGEPAPHPEAAPERQE